MDSRTDLFSIEKNEFSAYIEKPSSGYDKEKAGNIRRRNTMEKQRERERERERESRKFVFLYGK